MMNPLSRSVVRQASASTTSKNVELASSGRALSELARHRNMRSVHTRQSQSQVIYPTTGSTTTASRAYSTETTPPEEAGYASSPKETAAVRKRIEEELLLKSITTQPRRPVGKVPYEHASPADGPGAMVHPSGFVVPAPGEAPTSYADVRVRPADVLRMGFADNVRRFAELQARATAEVEVRSEKVPQEFHASDGRVEHPSGFVPPSPQMPAMEDVKEHYKPAMKLEADEVTLVGGGGGGAGRSTA